MLVRSGSLSLGLVAGRPYGSFGWGLCYVRMQTKLCCRKKQQKEEVSGFVRKRRQQEAKRANKLDHNFVKLM